MPDVGPLRANDPATLGAYRVTGRLGEGGQGVVFLGEDPEGTQVAVKVLRPDLAADKGVRSRFAREVTAAQRVAAQFCVAQVLDADLTADSPYVVTEYVDGPTLARSVRTEGPRTGAALHRLAVATATALTAIHEAGVAHRDFKPANVLLGRDGPRVIDFGIARSLDVAATQTGGIVGTPSYMAPEQFSGQAAAPADVFAWGCVMVFAANGRPPFNGRDIPVLMHQIINQEPDLGQLSGPLRDVVQAALRKDPAHRPGMQEILLRLLGNQPPSSPLPPPWPVESWPQQHGDRTTIDAATPRSGKARPLALTFAALAVAAVAVAGVVIWPQLNDSDKHKPSPSPSPTASVVAGGGPTRTPRLGLEFWQNNAAVPVTIKDNTDATNATVTVPLKPAPFQLRFPKKPGEQSLKICAWTDATIFTSRGGKPAKTDPCLGEGHGMADYEFGSGSLILNNEGFNYLIGSRFQSLSADTNKVDYAQTYQGQAATPLSNQRGDIYLAIYMPQAKDGTFHVTGPAELEYVILHFAA
ncbi:serine/threonine protein kinase [Actinomadura barringtoniae]|uniref:Serine/threonine protein kinase n=1 Tax=Actinomadura barringtoniae TaxID=1427535 RepID=A0A939T431_9ACTN|nr:serine/threonine-protein kinase [Actinomadura barringtoniae]MBO2447624.1 serine/threonine protein kinase [Actinomadura barringtoniae]